MGKITLGDTINKPKEYIANLFVVNTVTNEEFSFAPNSTNGKLVMSLPSGKYDIVVTADGYADVKDKLTVSDLGVILSEEKKNYTLSKK